MKHFTVEDIKYSTYESVQLELVGGSRPRLTLVHKKTHSKFIFKTYSHNSREVWAECLASHLGNIFNLDVQQVVIKSSPRALTEALRKAAPDIPKDWQPIGTLARNIFPRRQEIIYGATIVQSPSKSLSLDDIENCIRSKYYAADDLLVSFAQMILFDALIGNMDRHHENWGIVETVKYRQQVLFEKKQIIKERWFTQLFDHGSSLMYELTENHILTYLTDDDLFVNTYILGKSYSFVCLPNGEKANVFEVVSVHIKNRTLWGEIFRKQILELKKVSVLEIAKSIIKMPKTPYIDYSENRKELLLRSILYRKRHLENML